MADFSLRLLTAAAFAGAFLACWFWMPAHQLILVLLALGGLAAWEWSRLAGWVRGEGRRLYTLAAMTGMAGALYFAPAMSPLLMLATGLWLLCGVFVLLYPFGIALWLRAGLRSMLGLVVLSAALAALMSLHAGGPWDFACLLGAAVAVDTGGYVVGGRFGRAKMLARVSPGKTWMGLLGGVLFFAALCGALAGLGAEESVLWALVAVLPMLVIGDLAESMLKRAVSVKDSGALLPGHGGLLDRADSLCAALPPFALLTASG